MALWEWSGSGSVTKELAIVHTEGDASNYGSDYIYDKTAPVQVRNFEAHGMAWSEIDALLTVQSTKGDTTTITDHLGNTHTGVPISISWDPINGTAVFDVRLSLQLT